MEPDIPSYNTITLVSQGGGIGGGAYVVGVMKALKELGVLPYMTKTVASSAAAPAVVYTIMGQDALLEWVWTEEITKPEVVNRNITKILKGYPILDIDYLVEQILRKYPFDGEKFHAHCTEIQMSVTEAGESLEHRLLSNRDPYDPLLMVKAAIAIPAVYGKTVNIESKEYFDGGILSQLPHKYAPENENKIIIATEQSGLELRKSPAEEVYLRLCEAQGRLEPKIKYAIQNRHLVYAREYAILMAQMQRGNTILIQPLKPRAAGSFCNKPEKIKQTIQQGYEETMQQWRRIEEMLKKRERKAG